MRSLTRRIVVLVAATLFVAVALAVTAPVGSPAGPYVSALSDLAVTAAAAAPQCPNKGCVSATRCGHVTGRFGCTVASGVCDAGICR